MTDGLPDLLCLSHLRWDFVWQRPQHLMSRFARERRVFFMEEPLWGGGPPRLEVQQPGQNLWRVIPHLPDGYPGEEIEPTQQRLLGELIAEYDIHAPVLWFYTPMALGWLPPLEPSATVYDCMDELALFQGAPPWLLEREAALFERADVVFTGGPSLFESKRERHPNVHCFPSSIEREHFARAREALPEPGDQESIPHPRLGFFGVIDERMDLALVDGLAEVRPDWHIVLLGPVVKIDPAALPQRLNIHLLGMKAYNELPAYLSGWDVALMPFARNEATRFISPTKTPEFLAGGVPVVSTPIRDVVRLYGDTGLVHIAETVPEFVVAIEAALLQRADTAWRTRVDETLAQGSWQRTWQGMRAEIEAVVAGEKADRPAP